MIERASEFGASAAAPLITGDSTNKTAGDILREAREAHGLHLDVVAAALKVSSQKLAALENDDIEALPDPVFARALAASVCRALRIDPQPVLAKLPGVQRPVLAEADRTISKNLRSTALRSDTSPGRQPSRPMLVVVGLLLAGAAILFWLPQSTFEQISELVARVTARGEAAGSSSDTSVPAPVSQAPSAGGAVEPAAPSAPMAAAPLPTPSAAPEPAAPAAANPLVTSGDAVMPDDVIVFTAREDSWVNVKEQGGKQLLQRTIKGGETVGLTGTLPLSVIVGHASGVDVRVKGKPFDLVSFTRSGGVARFEVKP